MDFKNSNFISFFSRAMTFGYEKNDLMNTVGLAGEDWLDLDNLIVQACDLIKLFIGKKRQNRSNQVKIA